MSEVEKRIKVVEELEDEMIVEVSLPTGPIHRDVMRVIGTRDHDRIQRYYKQEFRNIQPDVYETIQCLCYLLEYCRFARISQLRVLDKQLAQKVTVFQLQGFNYAAKDCDRKGCNRVGVISCSKCCIVKWCSEDCLLACYHDHQGQCNQAFHYREALHL